MDCHLPNIASTSPGRSDGEKSSRYQQDSKEIVAMMLDQLYDPSACEKAAKCYFESMITPPITMDSLSELHMSSILSNGKLRHDLNFDKNLILRPNLNGRTGEKEEAQTSYWAAVTVELRLYAGIHEGLFTDVSEPTMFKACQLRIPPMFRTIKDILGTLVLEVDRAHIDRHLHVPRLLHDIELGVCDLAGTWLWIARLLKKYCGTSRDELVDQMVERICQGSEESVSSGLSALFSILEIMKLVW